MSISTVWIIALDEIAIELIDFIRDNGFPEMADLMQPYELYFFLQYSALLAANRQHKLPMTVDEYQERIRKDLRNADPKWNEFVRELVDEMYLKVSHDFPEKFEREKHFYITHGYGSTVHVDIFISEKALEIGVINIDSIAELVY